MKNLVTGATGFVGSHIVEKLKEQGEEVIAFARKTSDTSFLDDLGVEIRFGCLTDPASVYEAVHRIERVYHVAALADEWVPKARSYEVNVEGTANLLEASLENNIGRFFFISSLAVMGFGDHHNTGVETDYRKAQDPYIDTKMEAEKLVKKFNTFGLATTIIRPGFMYGPRDRRFLQRILTKLKEGGFLFVGDGKNKMNLNYAGNLADAVVLSSKTPESIGQAYNIANDDKTLDMETFIFKVADLWGFARPDKHIPVRVAKIATSIMEGSARLMRKKEPPLLTKTRLKFLSHNLEFDISKAKEEIGFENRVHIDEGLALTKRWMEENHTPDDSMKQKGSKIKLRLPFTYRDSITVQSVKYKKQVRNELQQLKEKHGSLESIIRLEHILGRTGSSSEDFEIDQFSACDRQILYFSKWKSKHPKKDVFVCLNGLESHSGWFSEMAFDLVRKGIAVYGLDRRGSGLNTRSIGTYQDWLNDVNEVVEIAKSQHPQARIHLAAICFGAVLATAYAIQQPEKIASLINLSPGMNVKVDCTPIEKLKIALDRLPGLSFNIPSPIKADEMFTDSVKALYFLYKDKLRTFSPRASDFYQAKKIKSYISEHLCYVRTPSLVLLAERDQVVDNAETEKTLGRFAKGQEIIEYPESEHVIFFGSSRDDLVSDIIEFINRLAPTEQPIFPETQPVSPV